MILSDRQMQAYELLCDTTTTELLFGGGAGGGKSVLGCFWIVKRAIKFPRTRWLIGRASLKTLKETTLNTLLEVCRLQGLENGFHFKYNDVKSTLSFTNGSQVLLKDLAYYPSDPNFDELGSLEISGAFVDECNQVTEKAWLILKSRIRYRLDEHGLVPKLLGTCNPAKNWVYQQFYSLYRKQALPAHKQFIQSLLGDNPSISKHYRDNLLSLSRTDMERLLYGNWDYDDDPAVLCDYDAIMDVFHNEHVTGSGEKYISADLAMQGRDRFVAGVWNGYVCDIQVDAPKATGKGIETTLRDLMIKYHVPHSHTVVDSDGLGAYLESYLQHIKTFHGGGRPVDAKEYTNLKSECAYKLAELVNKRAIKIICSRQQQQLIAEELGVLKRGKPDNDEMKKHIIKKETMKELLSGRSPDYLDMLLMRMYFEIKRPAYRLHYQ